MNTFSGARGEGRGWGEGGGWGRGGSEEGEGIRRGERGGVEEIGGG